MSTFNSLSTKIFPSGSQKYRNLEQETLQALQSVVLPYGVNISHKDKEKNFTIQDWMLQRNVNSTLKMIFKQTALMGNLIVIWFNNSEDGLTDIYLNNLFGLSNIEIVDMSPKKATLQVQLGQYDGKSPTMRISFSPNPNIRGTYLVEFQVSGGNAEIIKDITERLNTRFTDEGYGVKIVKSKVLPIHYFTYLPNNPVFTGVLGARPFNFAIRGANGCENTDGLQLFYDYAMTMLESELNTAYSTRSASGLTPQETKKGISSAFQTRIAKARNSIAGNIGNMQQTLELANPQFKQIDVIDNIVKQYKEGCLLNYETSNGASVNEKDVQSKIYQSKSYLEDVASHWDNQFFNFFDKILTSLNIPTKNKTEYLFTCAIRRNVLGEGLKDSETREFDLKHNLSNIVKEIAEKHNIDENNALTMLEQNIKINEKYKDAIFFPEKELVEIEGKLQEFHNHPEDASDMKDTDKQEGKAKIDKESV